MSQHFYHLKREPCASQLSACPQLKAQASIGLLALSTEIPAGGISNEYNHKMNVHLFFKKLFLIVCVSWGSLYT